MEIEKKYLLKALPFDMSGYDRARLKQGYISTDPVIRLRSEQRFDKIEENEKYILTVKGPGILAREEFEIEISKQRFDELWKKIDNYPIEKIRYRVPLCEAQVPGLCAEVDEYFGRLAGLFTVEVEFREVDDANAFVPPEWFGKDVTEDSRYGNGRMSKEIPPFDAKK